MSIRERVLGRRERAEGEPRSSVQIQVTYYPSDLSQRIRAIPAVEQAASDFFSEDKNILNVFLIQTPPLQGVNIPHFQQYIQSTGKYFEGYLQHTLTGFLKQDPLTDDQLAQARQNAESALQPGVVMSDADREEACFYGSLMMLDRLAEQRQFQLEVEPFGAKDFLAYYKNLRRLLRTFTRKDTAEPVFETEADVDVFLEQQRLEIAKTRHDAAELFAARNSKFQRFFDSVAQKASRSGKQVRIFVPKEVTYYPFDQMNPSNTEQQRKGVSYQTPQFINTSPDEKETRELIEDCQNPNAEVARGEIVKAVLIDMITIGMGTMGLESVLERDLEENPDFLSSLSYDEMHQVIVTVLLEKDNEKAHRDIMELYDRLTGKDHSRIYAFMQAIHKDPTIKEALSGMLKKAYDAHQPKEQEP